MGPLRTHSWLRSFGSAPNISTFPLWSTPNPSQNLASTTKSSCAKLYCWVCPAPSYIASNTAATTITSYVEERFLSALPCPDLQSLVTFPIEQPREEDWEVWCSFWLSYCGGGLALPQALGRWVSFTHRRWEWCYDASTNTLQQCAGDRRRNLGLQTRGGDPTAYSRQELVHSHQLQATRLSACWCLCSVV